MSDRRQLFSGILATSMGTLLSRVLGLARDIVTASLLGMSSGGVMDAFVVALRMPDLFRRMFGEGALTAAYLPALTRELEGSREQGWRFVSAFLVALAGVLLAVVVVGELICGAVCLWASSDQLRLVASLTAVLLPFLLLLCLTAQLAATLHAFQHFATPALTPVIVNIFWLIAACLLAPAMLTDKAQQAHLLAASITAAGVVQLGLQWWVVRGLGFRFQWDLGRSREVVRATFWATAPAILGLAVTQLNTTLDSLFAWGFSAPDPTTRIAWLGGVEYPMQQGAAAATYLGERLYTFPLGLVGAAVATVLFPILSRHAARGELDRVGDDLTLGLRIVVALATPASAGLVLLSKPITRLLFERGAFTPQDADRTALVIACYGVGVLAFCAAPILARGFFALGDQRTPLRVGGLSLAINIALNLTLIWPWREAGLAVSTSITAALHCLWLGAAFATRNHLNWKALAATAAKAAVATGLMSGAVMLAMSFSPKGDGGTDRLLAVALPLLAAFVAYFGVLAILGRDEIRLLKKPSRPDDAEPK